MFVVGDARPCSGLGASLCGDEDSRWWAWYVAVSNGAADSAVCWDKDANVASFRFLVVDEEAVVRGRLLCNGEQPRIQDFARNVQAVGVRSRRSDGGRIWVIKCGGGSIEMCVVINKGKRKRQ